MGMLRPGILLAAVLACGPASSATQIKAGPEQEPAVTLEAGRSGANRPIPIMMYWYL